MFNISIICVGKLKELYLRDAFEEYTKRLKLYAKLEVIELPEVAFSQLSQRDSVINEEAEAIFRKIKNDSIVIALSEEGKEFSSTEFSGLLSKYTSGEVGNTHITFIIGGALGLTSSVKKRANQLISFSKMTFTHQMIRVFLVEQIYRAGTIINKKQYHY